MRDRYYGETPMDLKAAADLRIEADKLMESARRLIVTGELDTAVLCSVAGRVAECAGALRYIADAIEIPR